MKSTTIALALTLSLAAGTVAAQAGRGPDDITRHSSAASSKNTW